MPRLDLTAHAPSARTPQGETLGGMVHVKGDPTLYFHES